MGFSLTLTAIVINFVVDKEVILALIRLFY
jgi:hypothetical protein